MRHWMCKQGAFRTTLYSMTPMTKVKGCYVHVPFLPLLSFTLSSLSSPLLCSSTNVTRSIHCTHIRRPIVSISSLLAPRSRVAEAITERLFDGVWRLLLGLAEVSNTNTNM